MRMRQAVLQFVAELYLLYCEYYLPFNCIICSYFSHVNPAGKKYKVNLRFFSVAVQTLPLRNTTDIHSYLTFLTHAANAIMINKKIIFIFLICMHISFKLKLLKSLPLCAVNSQSSLQKESFPGLICTHFTKQEASLQKEAHPGSQPHSQKGGRIL